MKHHPATTATIIPNWKKSLLLGVIAALPATGTLAAPGGTDRPHLGTCDAVVTPIGGFGFPLEPLELRIDVACQFRHLGRTTGVAMQEVTATGPVGADGVLPASISASIAYTAANGDVLYSEYSGPAAINVVTGAVEFEGVEIYDGGTGRFAQASGGSWLEGHASTITNLGFYVTKGKLSY